MRSSGACRPSYSASGAEWRGQDSNLRRLSRDVYSVVPLTAREPRRTGSSIAISAHPESAAGAPDQPRTPRTLVRPDADRCYPRLRARRDEPAPAVSRKDEEPVAPRRAEALDEAVPALVS